MKKKKKKTTTERKRVVKIRCGLTNAQPSSSVLL